MPLAFVPTTIESFPNIIEENAGGAISALKAVYRSGDGIYLADNSGEVESAVTGVAITGGAIGSTIQVMVYGVLRDSFFSFTPGQPVFLGSNGDLTQVAPSIGWRTLIGYAIAPDSITINIQEPINL